MKHAAALLSFVVLCISAIAAQDSSEAGIQSKVVALEKAWNQAYKIGDKKALDELLDNSIVLINDDGSVQSKKEFLASVHATNSQEQQVAPESMHVQVYGNVAIASGVMRVKGQKGERAIPVANSSSIPGYSRRESGSASRRTQPPSPTKQRSVTAQRPFLFIHHRANPAIDAPRHPHHAEDATPRSARSNRRARIKSLFEDGECPVRRLQQPICGNT